MAITGRLLILSLYYPPDLSAGSFRAVALVDALRRRAPALHIDVVTSMPNRYQSYSQAAPALEVQDGVTIRRLPMPGHRSDMLGQASSYLRFARHAAAVASARSYDLVVATSSRLMTATLGAWVARRGRTPLVLDIRDLFVDTMGDILPSHLAVVLRPVFSSLERWTMKRAAHVNLVSKGFEPYFRARYPGIPLSFFTNGIDDEFLAPVIEDTDRDKPGVLTVLYAGNIGEGQGLHAIIPALANALAGRARFKLIGDGGRRPQLVSMLRAAGVTNVDVVPPMPRSALMAEYVAADVLFLHLNNHEAFTRVLPSKIFEYAALGKPIWAGVAGYAAEFLRTEVSNSAVFAPCSAEDGMRAWQTLELRTSPRVGFVQKYSRRHIMGDLAQLVLQHLQTRQRP